MDLLASSKLTKILASEKIGEDMKVQDGNIVTYKQFSSTLWQGEKSLHHKYIMRGRYLLALQ